MTSLDNLAPLELSMQELEDLEAPGWWENFKDGVVASATISAVYSGIASAAGIAAT